MKFYAPVTTFHRCDTRRSSDERVTQISSVDFNHVRSVRATSAGLFEIDIQEMPNMVRAKGLPPHRPSRASQELRGRALCRILGIHPATGIMAKTQDDEVILA